jgi:hypothetical protein
MMTSRSLICLLENQNGGKLQKIMYKNSNLQIIKVVFNIVAENLHQFVETPLHVLKIGVWNCG